MYDPSAHNKLITKGTADFLFVSLSKSSAKSAIFFATTWLHFDRVELGPCNGSFFFHLQVLATKLACPCENKFPRMVQIELRERGCSVLVFSV